MTALPDLMNSSEFWKGLFTGLQEDPEEDNSNCVIALNAMQSLIKNSQLDFVDYSKASQQKGNTPTDIGYTIYWGGIFTESSLVAFNVYDGCYINLMLINWGQIFNTSARAAQFIQDMFNEAVSNCLGTGSYHGLAASIAAGSSPEVIG